jgi:L-ascorbate metabolism protein UlaG (beta-lactamase superfamily)
MGAAEVLGVAEKQTFLRHAERDEKRFLNPVPTSVGGWRTLRDALPEYLRNKEEKSPKTPLGPFRTDVSVYDTPPASGLRITWMGHSSTLIEIDGVRVLTDPVWDERASPFRWAGPKRFFAPPLALERMPRLDAVFISHDHYDHLGESTIRRLAKLDHMRGTQWITSLGVGEILEQYGVNKSRVTELDWTDRCTVHSADGATLEVTSVPSRHFSGRSMFNRFETLWSSFVLEGASHKVYFGADSGWWPGFAEIGAEYGPFDVTMLEIGAFNELWKDIHLGPDNAARAFMDLGGSGLMMPIHWGLFDLALHAWRQPIERMLEVAAVQGIQLWSPVPGEPTEVVAETEMISEWWR